MKPATGGWRIFAAVFLAALMIRLIYVAQILDNPFYSVLTFDSRAYDLQAHELIASGPFFGGAYVLGPLYVFFLAILHLIAGHSLPAVWATQAVLGALSCAMVFRLGADMFDIRVGVTGGVLASLYGPMAFYVGVILSEQLLLFVNLLLVWLLVRAWTGGTPGYWLAAGVALGVSAWGKPNILALVPAVIAMGFVKPVKPGFGRNAAIFVVACVLTVAPITARNALVGSLTPVTDNFEVNFYDGNNPEATGTSTPLNEFLPSSGAAYYLDGMGRGSAGGNATSDALLNKAFEYIRDDSAGWLGLMLKKAMLYLNAYEIPDMDNYNFLRRQSIIGYLIPSMAIIAPLGILGLMMGIRDRRTWPAAAYILLYSFTFIVFFVKARYRILVMPVLIVYCAYAVWRLADLWKSGGRALLLPAAALALLMVAVNNPYYSASYLEGRGMLNPYNNLGRAYEAMNDTGRAAWAYSEAITYNPGHYEPYNNLGALYNRLGDFGDAEGYLVRAVELDPRSPYAHANLGTAYYGQGRVREAKDEYLKALRLNPYFWEAHSNLGSAYLAEGDIDAAIGEYEKARGINPQDAVTEENLAGAYAARQNS
jgi:tetratricopeptide (TPR) repeat protein